MIPGQIRDLQLSEDCRQLDLDNTLLFPCSCYNVDVELNVTREVPWHWHGEIEAMVIVQGRGLLRAGGDMWALEEGDGVFLNSNTLHSVQLIGGERCRLHSLVFSADLLAGAAGSIFEQRYLRPLLRSPTRALLLRGDGFWEREAIAAIERAYRAFETEEFGWELAVRGELSRLWTLAGSHVKAAGPALEESSDTRRLKEMMEYLHKNFDRRVRLEEIATSASVSKRECLRCFQRTIGIAPIQYLTKLRIRQASHLLTGTGLPVTEVGTRCGFESPSYFSLTFRRLTGMTPREYRRHFMEEKGAARQEAD